MISYKGYVNYKTLSCRDEVTEWFSDDQQIYSNRDDYLATVEHLNNYKELHQRNYGQNLDKKIYRNIWAHCLTVLIPFEFHEFDKANKFVKEYMIQLSACYKSKRYLYCYKLNSRGQGIYADIICFTRKVYDIPDQVNEVHGSDYWWNPITKRRSTKKDPDAYLRHKKGDPKHDEHGNEIIKKVYVAPVENEIFKYTKFNIKNMTNWLRSIVNDVRLSLIRTVDMLADTYKKFISLVPRKEDATKFYIARKCLKNKLINDINSILLSIQTSLYNGDLLDGEPWKDKAGYLHLGIDDNLKSFNRLIYKINKIIHSNDIVWKKNGGDIGIYLGARQSFISFREELAKLKEYILFLIEEWWISVAVEPILLNEMI